MDKIDVVALITAVGGLLTSWLNYMHGRDDSKEVRDLKDGILQQAEHTATVTNMLNEAFSKTMKMLESLISALQ